MMWFIDFLLGNTDGFGARKALHQEGRIPDIEIYKALDTTFMNEYT